VKVEAQTYRSVMADPSGYGPFFQDQDAIQGSLEGVCKAWATYLQFHRDRTSILFGKQELPWEMIERAIVSTLSAAIIREFPLSVVLEEFVVPRQKPGLDQGSEGNGSKGRCDLWASIPELKVGARDFSFYLEAKRVRMPKTTANLGHYLNTDRGLSRLINDYLKARGEKIRKLSPYRNLKSRVHEHYVIGMMVIPLKHSDGDPKGAALFNEIKEILDTTFGTRRPVFVKGQPGAESSKRYRRMGRFPTVALVLPPDQKQTGMVATLTVFGSTSKFLSGTQNISD